MAAIMDSTEAHNYIVNPLHGPAPNEETGLNSTFRSTFARATESQESLIRQQKLQQKHQSPRLSSPLATTSSTASGRPRASSNVSPPSSPYNATDFPPRRGKSVNHGHKHTPSAEQKRRRRVSLQPIDQIDSLDFGPGGPYHHEGPYDATLLARNLNNMTSPVAAVAESNAAALKATPRENVIDAVVRHRPLDGTASVPPGVRDDFGRKYSYEEKNVMTEDGGTYGRWVSVGEDLDEAQRANLAKQEAWDLRHDYPGSVAESSSSAHGIVTTETPGNIELEEMKPKKAVEIEEQEVAEESTGISHRHSLRDGIKRRIGSLRRKNE